MKLHLIYIAIVAVVATACENEIPYNPGQREPLLIMNALLDAGHTENYVYLNLSVGDNIGRVNEGTLAIYVNGKLAESPQAMTSEETCLKFRLTTPFRPGDILRLEATAENGKYHASSEVTVPRPIENIKVDTCLAYLRVYNGQELYRQYKITMQDRPNEKNYYRLEILNNFSYRCLYREYLEDEDGHLIQVPTEDGWDWAHIVKEDFMTDSKAELINREDVILTDGHPGNYDDEENGMFPTIDNKYNIFTDNRFKNSSVTLKVYTPHYENHYPTETQRYYDQIYRTQTIIVRVLTLTEDEYRYLNALNCLDDDDYDNTLMEPVSLPGNVKGGLGFVGVCAETVATIEFPETPRWHWE